MTLRSYDSDRRRAVEAALIQGGLAVVGGGGRNTYYAVKAGWEERRSTGTGAYAVKVGPRTFRVGRKGSGGTFFPVSPERYHGKVTPAEVEAWARALAATDEWGRVKWPTLATA